MMSDQGYVFKTNSGLHHVIWFPADPEQSASELRIDPWLGRIWLHSNAVGQPLQLVEPDMGFGSTLPPGEVPDSLEGVRINRYAVAESWIDLGILVNLTVQAPTWEDGRIINPRPRNKQESKMMQSGVYDEDSHRAETALLVVSDHLSVEDAAKLSGFKADDLKAEAEGWAEFI